MEVPMCGRSIVHSVRFGNSLSSALDGNGDGLVDGCETYSSSISGDCALNQILQWMA